MRLQTVQVFVWRAWHGQKLTEVGVSSSPAALQAITSLSQRQHDHTASDVSTMP